ncbi:hypothetical protein MCOR28_000865 [Pyricularia oryzae]|nr:hypothetical protein MCOR26_004187 [Pyricularia oryzae]KAI6345249.1 hypothetical protein MCOR30_000971 [Pyricularia oryzae]KAI6349514.1 hypothetical protein MCOR28_000865 [Pyricularia oryzae]KAI6575418.1 hypothetical protein MCOR09_001678 [Pyricularia oryzae]
MSPQAPSPELDESTPLLNPDPYRGSPTKQRWSIWSPASRVLVAGFLITLSFSFTQVPIIYIFRQMVCDVYYDEEHHDPYQGTDGKRDRCDRNEIAARTAAQLAILAVSTTLCGTCNLFISAWQAKTLGPRAALMIQVFIPAIRVAAQIFGVLLGGQKGIITFQATQVITTFGGPAGYILIVNTIASEVVEPKQRTAVFGKLQGCLMLGQAIGFLAGGMLGDSFGIRRPFETAFVCFLIATVYVRLAIPYLPPSADAAGSKAPRGVKGFFAPLKVLKPQKVRPANGQVKKHYGVFFLCSGVFMGVLATGYVTTLVQLYTSNTFGFTQADNGRLISGNALMRAGFLTFMFPKIIDWGRTWFIKASHTQPSEVETPPLEMPTDPRLFNAPTGVQGEDQPLEPMAPAPVEETAGRGFDLYFLRSSLLVDAAVTSVAAYATEGWHMYIAAFLLPFASGTAPAAKGVITEMCPPSQRRDALGAITLVENIANLSTLSLFGFVFSTLAEIGQAHLTFFLNAAVAVLAMIILLFSHFPPANSELVEDEVDDVIGRD